MSAAYINYGDLPIATENFHCGETSLDEFIKEHAQTFIQKGLSAVTLLIEVETRELIGFYAISPFSIDGRALRSEQSKYYDVTFPIPAWKIGLLAVDKKHQRNSNRAEPKRYGSMLLQEAIQEIQKRADKGAGALILVDAIDKTVKKFYKKFGFSSIPNTSNQMVRTLAEQVD